MPSPPLVTPTHGTSNSADTTRRGQNAALTTHLKPLKLLDLSRLAPHRSITERMQRLAPQCLGLSGRLVVARPVLRHQHKVGVLQVESGSSNRSDLGKRQQDGGRVKVDAYRFVLILLVCRNTLGHVCCFLLCNNRPDSPPPRLCRRRRTENKKDCTTRTTRITLPDPGPVRERRRLSNSPRFQRYSE